MDFCTLSVGRLIAHPCGRSPTTRCAQCQQPVCITHRDASGTCHICTGERKPSTAPIQLSDYGDPLDFSSEVYAAFNNRLNAPPDELAGLDS